MNDNSTDPYDDPGFEPEDVRKFGTALADADELDRLQKEGDRLRWQVEASGREIQRLRMLNRVIVDILDRNTPQNF